MMATTAATETAWIDDSRLCNPLTEDVSITLLLRMGNSWLLEWREWWVKKSEYVCRRKKKKKRLGNKMVKRLYNFSQDEGDEKINFAFLFFNQKKKEKKPHFFFYSVLMRLFDSGRCEHRLSFVDRCDGWAGFSFFPLPPMYTLLVLILRTQSDGTFYRVERKGVQVSILLFFWLLSIHIPSKSDKTADWKSWEISIETEIAIPATRAPSEYYINTLWLLQTVWWRKHHSLYRLSVIYAQCSLRIVASTRIHPLIA